MENGSVTGSAPFKTPLYRPLEVARYLKLPPATVRAWVSGQKTFRPVIDWADKENRQLSFENLVEVYTLSAIRKTGVPLPAIRRAIKFVEREFKIQHPLAARIFFTDGSGVFLERLGNVLDASRGGQLAMKEILEQHSKRLQFNSKGAAIQLFPQVTSRNDDLRHTILIDPELIFGQPCIAGTRIPTDVIAERYTAGDSITALAEDYGCTPDQIEDAVRYELRPTAA